MSKCPRPVLNTQWDQTVSSYTESLFTWGKSADAFVSEGILLKRRFSQDADWLKEPARG